jgi:ADP-ribose pyrophosphatase YjhB (NUDIX family)
MMLSTTNTSLTNDDSPIADRLNDEEYGRALDTIVKANVDILILRKDGNIFLGRRVREPQPDWCVIGGRTFPGELPKDGAARVFLRETNLTIAPERFNHLGAYSFSWATRNQPPYDHGTQDVSIGLSVVLEQAEESLMYLDPNEYSAQKWFSPYSDLRSLHPLIGQFYSDYMSSKRYNKLRGLVGRHGSDSDIANAAKEFIIERRTSADQVKVEFDKSTNVYSSRGEINIRP